MARNRELEELIGRMDWLERELESLKNSQNDELQALKDELMWKQPEGGEDYTLPFHISIVDATHIDVEGGFVWRNGIHMHVVGITNMEITAPGYVILTLTSSAAVPIKEPNIYPDTARLSFSSSWEPGLRDYDDRWPDNVIYCIGWVDFSDEKIIEVEQYHAGYIDADKEWPDDKTIERLNNGDSINHGKLQLYDVDDCIVVDTKVYSPYFDPVQDNLIWQAGFLEATDVYIEVTWETPSLKARKRSAWILWNETYEETTQETIFTAEECVVA